MAEERARTAAKGWLTRAGTKLEAMLARGDVKSPEWRMEAILAENEFLRRLETFDSAQLAVESVIADRRVITPLITLPV